MGWLNYHHLYYFYTIASEGSIVAASKKLKLAQSTLSTQLSQFEKSCNLLLFDRKNRKLILTEEGQVVYDYAVEIVTTGTELQSFLASGKRKKVDKITIGVLDAVPKRVSSQIVSFVTQRHNTAVSIVEGSLEQLLARLKKHSLDFIVSSKNPPADANQKFYHRLMAQMPVFFMGSEKHLAVRDHFPESLNTAPMVALGPKSLMRSDLREYFYLNKIRPNIVAEVQDIELAKKITLDGAAISAMPVHAVSKEISAGEIYLLHDTPVFYQKLWFIAISRRISSPIAADTFENWKFES